MSMHGPIWFLKSSWRSLQIVPGRLRLNFEAVRWKLSRVNAQSSCRLKVFQDGNQVAVVELTRRERLLSKKLKTQIIRERLRNVVRWI